MYKRKWCTSLLFAVSLTVGSFGTAAAQEASHSAGTGPSTEKAELKSPSETTPGGNEKRITILHTNDMHAHVEQSSSGEMGVAKLAGLIQQLRAENPNTLLLDAGDAIHGTNFATLVRGESMVRVMNEMGYDAMTAGNHEFDYGQERLVELAKTMKFPLISVNIVNKGGSRLFTPYIIREVDGIKIGIFGLGTPETLYKTHPKNVEGLLFSDPVKEAKAMVDELKGKVDVIIALGHLGTDKSSTDTSLKVAQSVPGIDLFVDGHSHTVYQEGLPVGGTLIVSTGEYTKNLGVVDLFFQDNKLVSKKARLIDQTAAAGVTPDQGVAAIVEAIKREQQTVLAEKVAHTSVRLVGEREKVRAGETNLGDLITDAMLDATKADVALTNGGGIRASIEAGEVTKGDVITVLPFGNLIVTKKVSGADLKAALENGASDYPNPKGAFAQVAGMTYKIDPSRPKGSRVHSVTIRNEPIDPKRMYMVATNDFIAAGGDEYTMFKSYPTAGEYMALDEALIQYMQKLVRVSPKTEGQGRIEEAKMSGASAAQPAPAKKPDAGRKNKVYIVKRGDSLWAISRKYNTTWQLLRDLNKLENPDLIFPGQRIVLPK